MLSRTVDYGTREIHSICTHHHISPRGFTHSNTSTELVTSTPVLPSAAQNSSTSASVRLLGCPPSSSLASSPMLSAAVDVTAHKNRRRPRIHCQTKTGSIFYIAALDHALTVLKDANIFGPNVSDGGRSGQYVLQRELHAQTVRLPADKELKQDARHKM